MEQLNLDSMENDNQNSDDKTFAAYLVIYLFYFVGSLALLSAPPLQCNSMENDNQS